MAIPKPKKKTLWTLYIETECITTGSVNCSAIGVSLEMSIKFQMSIIRDVDRVSIEMSATCGSRVLIDTWPQNHYPISFHLLSCGCPCTTSKCNETIADHVENYVKWINMYFVEMLHLNLICFIRDFPLLQANITPWRKLKITIQRCSSTRCRENVGVNYSTSNPTSQISKGFWDLTNMASHWTRLRSNAISWKVYLAWFNTQLNMIV